MSIFSITFATEYFFILATVSIMLILFAATSTFKHIQNRKTENWIDKNCGIYEFSDILNSYNPNELSWFYKSGIRKTIITTSHEEIRITVNLPHRTIFKTTYKHLNDVDKKFFKNYLAVKLELEQVSSTTKSYAIIHASKQVTTMLLPKEIAQLVSECLSYSLPEVNITDNY